MSPIVTVVLFSLAAILFLLAGVLVLGSYRRQPRRLRWVLLGTAFILFAIFSGFNAYLHNIPAASEVRDWAPAVLALAAALAASTMAYTIDQDDVSCRKRESAARNDLKALERYRSVFEVDPNALVIKDRAGVYLAVNPAFMQLLGLKGQNVIGETDYKFFPESQASAFREIEERVVETGLAQTSLESIQGLDQVHWYQLYRAPILAEDNSVAAILVSGRDMSGQQGAEAALAGWKGDMGLLNDAYLVLEDVMDLSSSWETLLVWAGKIAGADQAGVWQLDLEQPAAVLKAGSGSLADGIGTVLKAREDLPWKVGQRGQTVLVVNYQAWPDCGSWGRGAGFGSAIGVPLKVKGKVAYALTLFYDEPRLSFEDHQVQSLSLLAQAASSSLQNAERLAAGKVQMADHLQTISKLQYRARLEHVMAVIAAHFISLDTENVDEGIQRSLETLARFSGIDRCYLVLFPKEGWAAEASQADRSAWYSYGPGPVEGSGEDISWKAFNWYLGKLNQFEIIHIPRLADIPLEDEGTADYLHSRGIKSFTAIPMVSNRSAIGYLGFESLHSEREWPADVLSVLKISADMFANLLNRKVLDKEIRGAREKGEQQVLTLEQHNLESGLITEMGELLQACRTAEEAYPIIVRYVRKQYPVNSGALYMIQDAKDPAEKVAAWGNAQPGQAEHELVLNECWGMRRGRLYSVQDPMTEPRCGHLKTPLQAGYLCVPLIAQGVAVGVLHLRQPAAGAPFTEGQEHLAVRIAEYIALSLVNLKLRDDLRSQAIRDPLTGLFNRRYMEETLDREIRRANRHSTTVGVIMLDIDQMKPINDHFGHDGGDLVLKALGRELLKMFRGEDVACRYGGDEFMIVVPEASLSDTWRKAEQIRDAVKRLNLSHEGKSLGPVSLSIGVGTYPDHGLTAERVVQSCDTALYAAKAEGRDRIMMGHETDV